MALARYADILPDILPVGSLCEAACLNAKAQVIGDSTLVVEQQSTPQRFVKEKNRVVRGGGR